MRRGIFSAQVVQDSELFVDVDLSFDQKNLYWRGNQILYSTQTKNCNKATKIGSTKQKARQLKTH